MKLNWGILSRRVLVSLMLITATMIASINSSRASALQITSRSLTLVAGASDGGSKIGGSVNHLFTFTPGTSGQTLGSIQFLYCTTASVTACVTPTGLVTTSATIFSQSAGANGFTLNSTTNGAPYLTRAPSAITGTPSLSYQLNTITNPTTANGVTFFVRITMFTGATLGGTATDTGSVAASTATQIILTGTMPESLIFCTGATVGTTLGIPDCSTATSGAVSFNQLFSPTDTATATSQMAASTNAASGYVITVNGATLTSGSNTIAAMGTSTTGVRGTGQFGLNLKLNTTATSTVPVGLEVAAAPNGTSLRGQASAGYNTVDNFKFLTGDTVARSDNTVAGPTNAQIFTSAYIVNVAGNQASGTYTSTLTYICTGLF